MRSSRAGVVLATLFAGTFVMGSAELVVVGILELVARDLGVSVRAAGLLVTAYALGIAVGGPVLTALTVRRPRRAVLLGSLGLYVAVTAASLVTSSFGLLLALRAAAGGLQGLFLGVAFAVAGGLVAPKRAGRAISAVFGGIAVSTALGVPLGTLLAQAAGWRATFAVIAVLGAGALAAAALVVPPVPNAGRGGSRAQARHALAPRVLAVLGVGLLILGGQFAALTYITPFLESVTGVSGALAGVFLLAYGVANAVGSFAGGRAADRDARATLFAGTVLLAVALGVLLLLGAHPAIVAAALVLWGLTGFGIVPSLQYRVVALAGPGRDLATSLPASAVTTGIALGSAAGGWALQHSGGTGPLVVALVAVVVAVPLTLATNRLAPPAVQTHAVHMEGRKV